MNKTHLISNLILNFNLLVQSVLLIQSYVVL
nr:MAG TPA: hypothetical protein [Caudoviricetes sp.]